jgi:hypothetical protein
MSNEILVVLIALVSTLFAVSVGLMAVGWGVGYLATFGLSLFTWVSVVVGLAYIADWKDDE